jgi:hypothetical protein
MLSCDDMILSDNLLSVDNIVPDDTMFSDNILSVVIR